MNGQVNVDDLEVFRLFRAALLKFAQSANQSIGNADAQVACVHMWLENEQAPFWQNQIRKRSEAVTLATGAVSILTAKGAPTGITVSATSSPDGRTWRLSFDGTGVVGGSVPDGIFNLCVSPAGVADLVGNPLSGNYSLRFHRLFGDADGDRDVDNSDLLLFRRAMKVYDPIFDYDNNQTVNTLDYLQLKKRLTRRPLM
jgi:hypothetical protein